MDPTQVIDHFLRRTERNQITQRLAVGKDRQQMAVVFGQIVAVQLAFNETGVLEMEVVEQRVLDPRGGQVAGHALLPNPFGHPHAANACLQPIFQPTAIADDLTDPIARRNHRHDRLVKRAADDFDSARGDQARQPIQILGMVDVEPLHQRPAGVQGHLQARIALEDVQKRPVAVLIGLLENVVEIADRLMVVQDKQEPNAVRHLFVRPRPRCQLLRVLRRLNLLVLVIVRPLRRSLGGSSFAARSAASLQSSPAPVRTPQSTRRLLPGAPG